MKTVEFKYTSACQIPGHYICIQDGVNDGTYVLLTEAEAGIAALRERQRVLVEAVKKSYLKHWLDDHSIGYAELGTVLMDALCNTLGDDGFSKWIGDYHKELAAKEG